MKSFTCAYGCMVGDPLWKVLLLVLQGIKGKMNRRNLVRGCAADIYIYFLDNFRPVS